MRLLVVLVVTALFGLLASTTGPWCAELPPEFDPTTMIAVSEVKPGMRGTGLSVFKGVEITEFTVEVLGILPKNNLGGDIVLIRVLDGPIVERGCGIIGGMSGSPISIGGRLLGAIAYTWTFEKEPIGGVTPIESMLNAYVEEPPSDEGATVSAPMMLHGRRITAVRIAAPDERAAFADANTINMVPVGVMTCAGLGRQALADFAEFLRPYGIEPVAGPGSMDEVVEADLVPGAAVSVDLLRGDFETAMIGTVTYRKGASILAFGHPMMQLGPVDMPLATAFIHDFVPAYSRTDKLGSPMTTVGAMRSDGAWSIGGLVGPRAPTVPIDITVTDEVAGRTRSFHCEAAKHKSLTQSMVAMAIANSVEAGFRPTGEGTAYVSFEIEGERGAKVRRHNRHFDPGSIAAACTREISSTIYVLRRNPYEPQDPVRVKVDIRLSDANTGAVIEQVYTDETVAKAGEKLTVHVVLRPWDGKPFEKVIELPLPEDLERGQLRLGVCGGEYAYSMRDRLGLLQPDFTDLPSIIKDIEETEHNNQLYVAAALPNSGLGVGQYLLHRLPSSVAAIMSSSRTTDIRGGREEVSRLIDCDHVILGQQYLTLGTEDKTGARAATPPPSAPTPPSSQSSQAAALGGQHPVSKAHLNPLTAPPLRWASVEAIEEWSQTFSRAVEPPIPRAEAPPPSPNTERAKKAPAETGGERAEQERPKEEADQGALARQLSVWRQTEAKDFEEGEAEGIAIWSDGSLVVADKMLGDWLLEPQRGVWSVVGAQDGSIYYGTGKDGNVYKFVEGTEPQVIGETGQLAVHALAFSAGQLYAGTAPQGKLFRMDPIEGKASEPIATFADPYIWALLPDGNGGVFVGTGSNGRIHHVSADGDPRLVAQLPAQHVLSLARLGDDLLAGTAENGVVYRVRPTGEFSALYDDEDAAVTGVAVTTSGEVYACTSPKGRVIRITPGKEPREVLKLEKYAATCMATVDETVYVGTNDDGHILAVIGPDRYAVMGKLKAAEVSCLAAAEGRVIVSSVNPGRVAVFDTTAKAAGTFESAVLDAERTARWATLLWTGDVPEGSKVEVQARVGHTADPDDGTWTAWSVPFPLNKATKIGFEQSRYIQYRVAMEKADGGEPPVFRSLTLTYLPANRKPELALQEPKDGASVSGKFKVRWEAKDPEDDKLRYCVYVRPEGKPEWTLVKSDIAEKEYEWDTKAEGMQEGVVAVRVVASDGMSNPWEPLDDEAVAFPVIVDNTPPRFRQHGETVVAADRTVTIEGSVWDEASPITSIEYRIGKEEVWRTLAAKDGLLDSTGEGFELRTRPLDPGEQTITIRARDAAGNKTDAEIKITIPEETKKDEKTEEKGLEPARPEDANKPKPVG